MVCNNTPFFFIRDPMKFPDVIHSRKRNPLTNMKDPNMHWDFISLTPESIQNIMFLFSDRGVPASYKHMDGFSAHAYKWVNEQGEAFFVKYHIKADLKHKPLLPDQIKEVEARTYDYLQEDLYNLLASG